MKTTKMMTVQTIVAMLLSVAPCTANPLSKPYIPFRTEAADDVLAKQQLGQPSGAMKVKSKLHQYMVGKEVDNPSCPLQFSLGVTEKPHSASRAGSLAIVEPPLIYPAIPSRGPGRQVLLSTHYEHVHLLTAAKEGALDASSPSSSSILSTASTTASASATKDASRAAKTKNSVKETLISQADFPLLFESSAFLGSPVLGDVNQDGIVDAIVVDYDGGLIAFGLKLDSKGQRYFHKAQVPRLLVRRQWMVSRLNETLPEDQKVAVDHTEHHNDHHGEDEEDPQDRHPYAQDKPDDPYHSYFEYSYGQGAANQESKLQGVSADLLGQEHEDVQQLEKRRKRRHLANGDEASKRDDGELSRLARDEQSNRRRLQEVAQNDVESFESSVDREGTQATPDASQQQQSGEVQNQQTEQQQDEQAQADESQKQEQFNQQYAEEQQQQQDLHQEGNQEDSHQDNQRGENQAHEQVNEQEQQPEQIQQNEVNVENGNAANEVTGDVSPEGIDGEQKQQEHQDQPQDNDPNQHEQDQQQQQQQQDASATLGHEEEPVEDSGPVEDDYYRFHGDEEKYDGVEESFDSGDNPEADEQAVDEDEEDREQEQLREYNGNFYGDDGLSEDVDEDTPAFDEYKGYDEYRGYDDYYGRYETDYDTYYNEEHYVRIPPHVLCAPVLVEAPKLYGKDGEMEDLLFVAVSYYLDEDEYEGFFSYKRFDGVTDYGDETEVQRGMYVSNAIMVYQFGSSPRWGRQEHLDLSTDHSAPVNTTLVGSFPLLEDNTRKGAFALSTPTIADIDGDDVLDVMMGTSMGFLYIFDARHLYTKDKWPVQLQYGIESRVIVEDVRDDSNLEIFVADVGGNVLCLNHNAEQVWHRDLVDSVIGRKWSHEFAVKASSSMVLGDVDGDGLQDIVLTVRFQISAQHETDYIFALSAVTGRDVEGFPLKIVADTANADDPELGDQSVHQKLPAPLLVDLHGDQSFLSEYVQRGGHGANAWDGGRARPKDGGQPSHGGNANGLHIVQPIGSNLIIVEAGSGCTQTVSVGQEMLAMIQVDDVHGTNSLDLVITTTSGNVITLESQAPYHPLNTWNHGEMRGPMNAFSHGYSASQGIFVHDVSRQYRDIFGVYIPVTFEIFDNRPGISQEPARQTYPVEIRNGKSFSRTLFRKVYKETGVYTERLYIPYGPGFYVLTAMLKSTHGLVYEDSFHLGYNVHYMDGFGILLWLPLVLASICIFLCGARKVHWEDDDFDADGKGGGILGGTLPE